MQIGYFAKCYGFEGIKSTSCVLKGRWINFFKEQWDPYYAGGIHKALKEFKVMMRDPSVKVVEVVTQSKSGYKARCWQRQTDGSMKLVFNGIVPVVQRYGREFYDFPLERYITR